jgi:hypothetical protein
MSSLIKWFSIIHSEKPAVIFMSRNDLHIESKRWVPKSAGPVAYATSDIWLIRYCQSARFWRSFSKGKACFYSAKSICYNRLCHFSFVLFMKMWIPFLDNARLLQPLCQFILLAPGGVQNRPSAVKKLLSKYLSSRYHIWLSYRFYYILLI